MSRRVGIIPNLVSGDNCQAKSASGKTEISKVKKMLGYHAEVDFEEDLKKTAKWFKSTQNPELIVHSPKSYEL
jgi:nucleoside-diphosphate-sugar epimerase